MGKKNKNDKKGKGKEKTAMKTEKKAEKRAKKELAKKGEAGFLLALKSSIYYFFKMTAFITKTEESDKITVARSCICICIWYVAESNSGFYATVERAPVLLAMIP